MAGLALFCAIIMLTTLACINFPQKDTDPNQGKNQPSPDDKDQIILDYDPNRLIFLLIGQSNMEGVPKPESRDMEENPRIHVLAYKNSPRQGWLYNQWYIASPPLHSSYLGLGIGDYFAKTLAKGLADKFSIGLVPCGISGVDIDFF